MKLIKVMDVLGEIAGAIIMYILGITMYVLYMLAVLIGFIVVSLVSAAQDVWHGKMPMSAVRTNILENIHQIGEWLMNFGKKED